MDRTLSTIVCLFSSTVLAGSSLGFSTLSAEARDEASHSKKRAEMIADARVWEPTTISKMDLRTGPGGPGSFPVGATVPCTYKDEKLTGRSPKFICAIKPDDEVKVKYGGTNGEVYAEVAATRLLWALGFGADRMYPARIVCRGCPKEFGGSERSKDESVIVPAVIERKMPGKELFEKDGWKWTELDLDDSKDSASRAERDALKLLAVLIQHTDNKAVQQRLLSRDAGAKKNAATCDQPFLMINDLGLTFGKASRFNNNSKSGMNLTDWSTTPIWKERDKDANNDEGPQKCVGNLPKSFTGTLEDPVIGEEGRRFLAGLLTQLTDSQLHDLFDVSQV